MIWYLILVTIIRMLVIALLLLGSQKICMQYGGNRRILVSVLLEGLYTLLCFLPGQEFFSHLVVHVIVTVIIGFIGVGRINRSLLLYFSFLALLEGAVFNNNVSTVVLFLVLGSAGCFAVFLIQKRGVLLPVNLSYGEKSISIYALHDTGNLLKDPVTGKAVLVVSPKVAGELIGITWEQIQSPVENLSLIPGLRLIPYKSIGNSSGFMLGLFLDNVRVGGKKEGRLIAFAPNGFGDETRYQALTGGVV